MCCYARSDKHWITDPQAIAWEHFHSLANIPVFSAGKQEEAAAYSAACSTLRGKPIGIAVKSGSSCC